MIVASIDIGTNTALLLIAEVDLKARRIITLHDEQRMPRIGRGLSENGVITQDRIDSLMNVLAEYRKKINSYNCSKIIATGTNALRIAKNSKAITGLIKNKVGLDIEIISGEKEAELAHLGALSGTNNSRSTFIIDIGGGSTELIAGIQKEIIFKQSFPIGSVNATEKYFKHSPPTNREVSDLKAGINNLLRNFKNNFAADFAIGIAGTVTTLSCMINGMMEFQGDRIEGSSITITDLEALIQNLQRLKPEEILRNYGTVLEGREDIITAGAMILSEIITLYQIENLTVSARGIRYGAIVSEFFSGS